jgi:hypothetical protein
MGVSQNKFTVSGRYERLSGRHRQGQLGPTALPLQTGEQSLELLVVAQQLAASAELLTFAS